MALRDGPRRSEVAAKPITTDTHVMAPKSSPQPAPSMDPPRVLYRPHPSDAAEIGRSFEEADRGELLDPDTTEKYLRWLETGEGPCPLNDESHD